MDVEVKNVSFSYGHRKILKNISFSVNKGNLLCVLGPNGVGKTTLFRCILGLIRHYNGSILIDGVKNISMKPEQIAKKVAYVPQSHSEVFNYTVKDIVLMGTTPGIGRHAVPGAEQGEQALKALEKMGIVRLADRFYSQISGGEAQLVLIARAIAQQAKILVMDEPTANLDYGNQVRVMDEIKKLTKSGYTVIQSTHNPEQAFFYADSVIAMLDGNIVGIGKPKDVLSKEMLFKIYGVKVCLYDLCCGNVRVCVPER